jgi:methylglutaconyl-CoA hydratase
MSEELVHLEISGGVATVTLDSPHNRNALSRQLLADLDRQINVALGDDRARLIVLTAAGPVFCSGADLKEQRLADGRQQQTSAVGLPAILTAMWNAPKPVIGRINGAARAGGLGLVAACDITVAVETATFAVNEVRIGVIPAIISVVVVPKIGEANAMKLFLTGDVFDARAAVDYGLINVAAPADGLDAAMGRYVESILKGAPEALAGCKQLVRDVVKLPMGAAFDEMAGRSARYFASAEALEGMQAFAEKRPPRWITSG